MGRKKQYTKILIFGITPEMEARINAERKTFETIPSKSALVRQMIEKYFEVKYEKRA